MRGPRRQTVRRNVGRTVAAAMQQCAGRPIKRPDIPVAAKCCMNLEVNMRVPLQEFVSMRNI